MPRVTITVPEKTPQPYRFELDRESVTLGRGSENDIAIDCSSVSVKHAEMRRVKGGYELRDLGSTNGIKVGGERSMVVTLHNGLPVKLGDVAFDFMLTDEEMETLADETPEDDSAVELPPDKKLRPIKALRRNPKHMEQEELDAGGGGFGMVLLFFILAVAAFAAGMAVRFQKDTGNSLIQAIQAKISTMSAPAAEPATPPSSGTEQATPRE